jgi:hypothetical protein
MPRRFAIVMTVASLCTLLAATDLRAASDYATPAFQQRWAEDEGVVRNFWGPLALASAPKTESYTYRGICGVVAPCFPDRTQDRLVQYFDKGRMEYNPNVPGAATVTSGLLVREMISGNMQTGDTTVEKRQPAAIPIAGDPDNIFPKYSDLTNANIPPVLAAGSPVKTQLNPDGSTSAATDVPNDPAAAIATTDTQTNIAVPRVFTEFRDRIGLNVIGYAVSGPFYVNVRVGGVQRRVLMQAFERRVLTYNPANPPEFQVEFGNVGRHYYRWRYGVDPS